MQSIGERLEDARKRKGISLREAAEATKIRSDFLASIEQNKFDFELPEIYKRGFLKNYARYLKLDPEKIVADYSAQLLSNSTRLGRKTGSEWFGQMEVKSESKSGTPAAPLVAEEARTEEDRGYGRIAPRSAPAQSSEQKTLEQEEDGREHDTDEGDKIFYIKAGVVCVGTLALVFVIFGLIRAILGAGGDAPAPEPQLRDQPTMTQNGQRTTARADQSEFTITATGNVYILVRQRADNAELYRRTMAEGESVTLEKEGPVDILFTAGENFYIDHAGERIQPSAPGTARISLQ